MNYKPVSKQEKRSVDRLKNEIVKRTITFLNRFVLIGIVFLNHLGDAVYGIKTKPREAEPSMYTLDMKKRNSIVIGTTFLLGTIKREKYGIIVQRTSSCLTTASLTSLNTS